MTSRDFVYWLQGYIEIQGTGPMSEAQVKKVAAHLASVFVHEIDPAMGVAMTASGISTRPGRIDAVIELGAMTPANRTRMAEKILADWPDLQAELCDSDLDLTPAQFQEMCIQAAYQRMERAQE